VSTANTAKICSYVCYCNSVDHSECAYGQCVSCHEMKVYASGDLMAVGPSFDSNRLNRNRLIMPVRVRSKDIQPQQMSE